ncbi:hypothetical protein [Streptomyces sp. NBRC 109706]|uniref:hypothetical protein n=1 Tax=Streptomyces sp. NBRC 109706 TaxID=1550035 RepID=UPI000785CC0D|nr:hypothetical protein [Streptomyces sp. NBRC 109706]
MSAAIIAVVGTLAGSALTGLLGYVAAQRGELRWRRVDALTELSSAATDHRRTMYSRFNLERSGTATGGELAAAKAESYATRAAVTAPLVRVRLLIPDVRVRAAATELVSATYALRDAVTQAGLDRAREAALAAHDAFVDTAASYLA